MYATKQLLTTLEVRDIMHKHGNTSIWTNKRKGGNGTLRGVKCYYYGEDSCNQLVEELKAKAGKENVRVIKNSMSFGFGYVLGSIIVTCVLK